MWLTSCLAPDFKTIADFRKDNGPAIRKACREFIVVCGRAGLLTAATVAIDGSKFKAVNSRDRNFTLTKVAKRLEQIEASIERYLSELETIEALADRGYYDGKELLACGQNGVTAYVPRFSTSGAKAEGQAGFRLQSGRCLSLPRRRALDLSLHQRRRRQSLAPLLHAGSTKPFWRPPRTGWTRTQT
jgi:hypothetical protein